MAHASSNDSRSGLTLTQWLILLMASIGFAFDIYVLLVLPLILPPALAELLPNVPPGSAAFNNWRGLMFWVPAMVGGAFGLVGGYLTDRLGRRRVLTWSILLYGVATFGSGLATSMPMLLVLRCLSFVGVCVEFVAAVAWLAELFPDHKQRERALGYTQAFSSFGGLLVSGVFLFINKYHNAFPALSLGSFLPESHAPWRYMMLSGLVPAIPLIIVRPFLPESPVWQQKKDAGTLRRPSFREVFSPALARTTIVSTIMMACSYGAAFGAIQQIPQIVPGLPEVKTEAAAALEKDKDQIAEAAAKARAAAEKEGLEAAEVDIRVEAAKSAARRKIVQPINGEHAGRLSGGQEIGGLIGRFLLALLVVRIVSRRSKLSEGQGAELLWRDARDKGLTALDALKIYALKTAPAFEAALYAGLRLAGPAEQYEKTVAEFSKNLGVAFQVLNDLKDWDGDSDNKLLAGQDVLAARPTLLLALALEGSGPAERAELLSLLGAPSAAGAAQDVQPTLARVRQLFTAAAVFDKADKLVEKFRARAEAVADEVEPTELRELLYFLVDTVLDRQPPPPPEPADPPLLQLTT